jgi:hypothetical protein
MPNNTMRRAEADALNSRLPTALIDLHQERRRYMSLAELQIVRRVSEFVVAPLALHQVQTVDGLLARISRTASGGPIDIELLAGEPSRNGHRLK